MSSPHLPPAEDPRRAREYRADDAWVDPRQTGEMHFLDHLEELRRLLQQVFAGVAIGALAGWWLAPRVLADLIARTVKTTVVMSPFEAFNERIKLAALIGLMIALPYVLWRIWSFVLPGLLRQERRWVVPLSLASCVLFATGAWAAYSYVVPLVIDVLQQFLTPGMVSQIRLSLLLDFFYNMALACGVLMQLPLVTMLLTGIGLVTPMFLLQQWRVALVGIFVITAAITPGDVVSAQVVMGGPMALLYFVSVGLSFFVAKRKTKAEEAEAAEFERGDIGHD